VRLGDFKVRAAQVRSGTITDGKKEEVANYLPDNYSVVSVPDGLLIVGVDVAGWTMDDYVIPRLASGLLWAEELT
jgi:hypothetical protein